MIIRTAFTTNSSSTSFLGWGIIVDRDEIERITKALRLKDWSDICDTEKFEVAYPNPNQFVVVMSESYKHGVEQEARYIGENDMIRQHSWTKDMLDLVFKANIDVIPQWILCVYGDW